MLLKVVFPLDGEWDRGPPPIVHHHLFGIAHVELQVVTAAPCDKTLDQSSALLLIVVADASNNGVAIGGLQEVAWTRVEVEI